MSFEGTRCKNGGVSVSYTHLDVYKRQGQYQTIYTDVAGDISGSGVLVNIRGEVIGIINTSVRTCLLYTSRCV